jgi:hypothetical protein
MKHVLLIDSWPVLKDLKDADHSIAGIYFGNEFCDFLMPTPDQIARVAEYCRDKGYFFTIVLPYVNQRGIKKMMRLLSFLDKKYARTEIIVNDWGTLHYIRENKLNLIPGLGRLMTRQKRGFYLIKDDGAKVPVEKLGATGPEKRFLKFSVLQNDYFLEWIKGLKIRRIGLDNLLLGIEIPMNHILIDLYFPHVYITTSNYCLMSVINGNNRMFEKPGRCPRYCLKQGEAQVQVVGRSMFLKGNTQFVINEKLPAPLKSVDRLVETRWMFHHNKTY